MLACDTSRCCYTKANMDDQNELVKDFLIESFEYLDSLDEDLLVIENESDDPEVIARIFRAVHTIKGTGGFLNFEKLVSIAHVGEELLDGIRKDRVEANSEVVGALFELVDALREVLMSIEETGQDGEKLYEELIETLKSLQSGGSITPAVSSDRALETKEQPTPQPKTAPPPAEPQQDVEGKDEIVAEFLAQSFDNLDEAEKSFDELELENSDDDLIDSILGHTEVIRGSGGFLSYQNLAIMLLEFRNVLNGVKNEEISFDESAQRVLKDIISAARQILANIEFLGNEGDLDFSKLIQKASNLKEGVKEEEAELTKDAPTKTSESKTQQESGNTSDSSQEAPPKGDSSPKPAANKKSSDKKGGASSTKDKNSLTE